MPGKFPVIALISLMLAACAPQEPSGPVVLAASSMTEALTEAAQTWEAAGHAPPVLSFSASSALARQVSEGAPADLVVTADAEWMDWLEAQGHVDPASRRIIAGNRLVLVAPLLPNVRMRRFDSPEEPLRDFAGRLALADPASVPAGRYARAALTSLGLWDALAPRTVAAENVRAALALVEHGEAQLGIVYASDAAASGRVFVLAEFDPALHPPIAYFGAVVDASRHPEAGDLLAFLADAQVRAILVRRGFQPAD